MNKSRKLSGATLLLFGVAATAQSKPAKPAELPQEESLTSWAVTAAPMHQYPAWSDRINKNGHYIATFDDPNNEYRCDVVSYLDSEARNVLYSDITSLTIVCTKKREPKHED
jgi:hypothetical protein